MWSRSILVAPSVACVPGDTRLRRQCALGLHRPDIHMPHRIAVFRLRISGATGRSGRSSPGAPSISYSGRARRATPQPTYERLPLRWSERLHSSDAEAAWNGGNARSGRLIAPPFTATPAPKAELQTEPLPCIGPTVPVPERLSRHTEATPSSRHSKERKSATMAWSPWSPRPTAGFAPTGHR